MPAGSRTSQSQRAELGGGTGPRLVRSGPTGGERRGTKHKARGSGALGGRGLSRAIHQACPSEHDAVSDLERLASVKPTEQPRMAGEAECGAQGVPPLSIFPCRERALLARTWWLPLAWAHCAGRRVNRARALAERPATGASDNPRSGPAEGLKARGEASAFRVRGARIQQGSGTPCTAPN